MFLIPTTFFVFLFGVMFYSEAHQFRGRALKAYVPKKTAFAIPVGTGWAVVVAGPIRLYGSLAYVIRHVIDFMYFAKILSIPKLFDLFFKGWKYRSVIPKN
jgi:NADH dehydrogenase FAD-containing subunit